MSKDNAEGTAAQRVPLPERDPGTCRRYRHGAPDLAHWKRDDCVDWTAVPCPHARPTWRMCSHCLGLNAAAGPPPVDNAHVAPGCQPFDEATIRSSQSHMSGGPEKHAAPPMVGSPSAEEQRIVAHWREHFAAGRRRAEFDEADLREYVRSAERAAYARGLENARAVIGFYSRGWHTDGSLARKWLAQHPQGNAPKAPSKDSQEDPQP